MISNSKNANEGQVISNEKFKSLKSSVFNSLLSSASRFFKARVLENLVLNKDIRLLTISPILSEEASEHSLLNPRPGQFYMLQTGDTYDPLLKRPFSIFDYKDNTLKFLYRVKGKGTSCLSNLKNGDLINVIGPLGNNYPIPEGDFIAVAGGIGIASLFPLLKKFKQKAYLFYGARNKEELIMVEESSALAKEIFIATEDGSVGKKGMITEVLKTFRGTPSAFLYACGPTPMLKELFRIVVDKGIKCYVSLEEHMACGVGACLGCVVKTKGQASSVERQSQSMEKEWTYKRVCKEGPVFEIKEIVWE